MSFLKNFFTKSNKPVKEIKDNDRQVFYNVNTIKEAQDSIESKIVQENIESSNAELTNSQQTINTDEIDSITSNTDITQATFSNETRKIESKKQDDISQVDSKDTSNAKKSSFSKKIANTKSFLINKLNYATEFLETLFVKEPLVYSLAYENNIACKFNDKMLTTKDGNLCAGVKIIGISYAGATMNKELELATSRNQFWNRLSNDLELNIFCKKELMDLNIKEEKINNIYAEEIIKKWESGIKAYKITYTLIFSTKKKRIAGYFESKKRKMTEEQEENKDNLSFENKEAKLKEILQLTTQDLSDFNPVIMTSDEILNFYATYSNMQNTNFKYSNDLITDCYITSDVEFKKDYMIFYTNLSEKHLESDAQDCRKKVYARFISVKAYETEMISSIIPTGIIRESSDYYFMIHCEAINRDAAIKKIKRVRTFSVDIVKDQLEELVQLLQSERENIIKISMSVLLVSNKSLEDLNEKTDSMKSLLEKQNLSIVKETLNQKALYFSFFPSRGNLNARMRHQTGAVLSSLCQFENDIIGNNSNRWGARPITTFQHLSGSPFLFNLHDSDSSSAVGHTLVIGGTGFGKTTIMQFIMLNLFKYDINIFAMDKLRGMHNFTEYLGCEYHDLGYEKFKLNPFSLEDTAENNEFLKMWLSSMMNITTGKEASEAEIEAINVIQETIKSLRSAYKGLEKEISLKDFYDSIKLTNEKINLKMRIEPYLKSLFDNKEDALGFKKQMSILNMDSILNNQELAGLSAMYLFHKIKNISKNADKGFFIWIDELRDYLGVESMRNKIIEAIVEIRKINGVITMGIQNLDFLDGVANSNTFIDNMSNFIIFPTNDENTLAKLQEKLGLSETELNFLRSARKSARQILYKQKEVGSCILDVNLGKLGDYLRVFSSSSNDVAQLNALKLEYPRNWRQMYLRNIQPKENITIEIQKRQEEEIEFLRKKEELEREKEKQRVLDESKALESKQKNKPVAELVQENYIEKDLKKDSKDSKNTESITGNANNISNIKSSDNNVAVQPMIDSMPLIDSKESTINDEILKDDIVETNIYDGELLESSIESNIESSTISNISNSPQIDNANAMLLQELQQLKNEIKELKSNKNLNSKEEEIFESNEANVIESSDEDNENVEFNSENESLEYSNPKETHFTETDSINLEYESQHSINESDFKEADVIETQQLETAYNDIKIFSYDENIESNIINLDIKDSKIHDDIIWNIPEKEEEPFEPTPPEESAKEVWGDSSTESNTDSKASQDSKETNETKETKDSNTETQDSNNTESSTGGVSNEDSNSEVIESKKDLESNESENSQEIIINPIESNSKDSSNSNDSNDTKQSANIESSESNADLKEDSNNIESSENIESNAENTQDIESNSQDSNVENVENIESTQDSQDSNVKNTQDSNENTESTQEQEVPQEQKEQVANTDFLNDETNYFSQEIESKSQNKELSQ